MKAWNQFWSNRLRYMTLPCRNEEGIAAVEMGATILVFLMAVFAVTEFGWYFLHQTTLTAAVRDGIRIGTIGSTLDDGQGGQLSREDSIKKAIKDKADGIMVIDPGNIQVFPVDADFTDPDDPAVVATASAGGAGAFMRVRTTYQHQFFTSLIGGFFGPDDSLQMVSEGTYRNENFILGGGS